jgi:hypothetical protein
LDFMKQNFYTKIFFLLLLFWGVGERVMGQVTLPHYEAFNYTAGTPLQTQVGWTAINTGDNIDVLSGNLSYTGMPAPIGNKIGFAGIGIDAYKSFTNQTSGSVYYSLLLNVKSMAGVTDPNGGYIVGFIDNASTTNYGGTLWTKRVDDNTYNIGIEVRTATGTATTFTTTNYTTNTTYLIVVKYTFVTGTNNDEVRLWVNPAISPTEPTPTLLDTHTGTDLVDIAKFLVRQDSNTETPDLEIDELRIGTSWSDVIPTTPSLSVSPASLSGFTTTVGSASSSQTYTLSGSSLTPASGNITVTAPANFEVSTDNSTFSASLNVAYNSGTLSATTIYVRIAASAPAGPVSGNVANAGGGATTQNVAVSGTVNPLTPALTVTPASLNPFSTNTNTSSAVQDYIVSASNLTSNLVITAPAGFEIKRSTDATYASSVTLVPTSGNVPNTTINVRLAASNTNAKILIANITNTSGTLTENVAVRGVVNATLANFPDTPKDQLATPQTYTFSAVGLSENLVVTNNDNQNYSLSKDGTNFVSTLTFTPAEVNNNNVTISVRFEPKSDVNGLKPVNLQHSANALTAIVSTEGKQLAPLSIADELAAQTIVFPNPASKFIQVQTSGAYQITLQDVTGRKVGEFISNETINVEKLPNGLYFLQFSNENVRFVKRLIIQK